MAGAGLNYLGAEHCFNMNYKLKFQESQKQVRMMKELLAEIKDANLRIVEERLNKTIRILNRLVDSDDKVESAHDVEAWAEYPKCGNYSLKQIKAIQSSEKEWMDAKKEAKEFLDNL